MRYVVTGQYVIPRHCIFGQRPAEGIVLNNVEWWSITDHLIKEQKEKEIIAVLREKEEAKKQVSYNMTKTWKNTLASIKTLANQRRIEKTEKEKQDKIDKYNNIMKNRKEEKKELLQKVKQILCEENDASKTVNSAVLLSTVLDERRKQIEFKKSLSGISAIKDKELAAKLKKEAEDFEREKLDERIKEKAKKRTQKIYLDRQMEEVMKKKQAEADELEAEKQDLKNMRIEAEKIRHCNAVEQKYKKEFAANYIKKTENRLDFERLLVLEQQEEDAISQLFLDYSKKFEKERKEREKKMKEEVIERRNKISVMLAEKLQQAAKKEAELLRSATEQKKEEMRLEEDRKEKLRKQTLADLLEGKKKAEEDRARRDKELFEQKKWEMVQQYRSAEVNEEWREQHRRKKKETQARMKAIYDEQCEEIREKREKDLKEWLTPLVSETRVQDDIRQYYQSTLDFVKKHNIPEYPVLAAIKKVQKEYGIKEKKKEMEKNNECEKKKQKPKLITGLYHCFKY